MGGRPECTAIDFGQAEGRVLTRDDHVGVADEPDAAAQAEAVHGGDDRDLALVDSSERGEAAAVGADQGGEPRIGLDLLDVDAGVEAAALGAEHDRADLLIGPGSPERVGEREPARHRQRVHRRVVDHDLGHPACQCARNHAPGRSSSVTGAGC